MTEKEFGVVLDMLVGAYGSKMEMTEQKANTYYDFLKKYNPKDVWSAAREWIKENRFAPTISDLISLLEQNNE